MLSKSQARLFFVLATSAFSLVFLLLTVDTLRAVPARSHEEDLDARVIRGKTLWDKSNCMGCHTLLGEGAYYAPELTKVVERRGGPWIKIFLKDPAAMFPGQRRMVKYDFSDDDIDALVAFFTWIGRIDTNGFPQKPDLAPTPAPAQSTNAATKSATAAAPPPAMFTAVCQACHSLHGTGGAVGPALDGVGARHDRAWLDSWLKNPQAIKPGTAMPNLSLPDATRSELVDWLVTL